MENALVSCPTTFSELVLSSERVGIRLFAVLNLLEAYFDDSSDENRKRYCAYGGWIGASAQWDAQLIGWGNASYGLTEPFRSTDCETGHGQFEGIEKPERDARMTRMVDVLKATELRGFASIVPVATYREVFPHSRENEPSLLTLRQAMMNMAYIGHNLQMDVQIWFENGSEDGAISEAFSSIVACKSWEPAKRLRTLSFDTKRSAHLQAADFVAREAFKHIDNRGIRPMRIPVKRLVDRLAFVLWNREALQFMARNGGFRNIELHAHWDSLPNAPKFGWHVVNELS